MRIIYQLIQNYLSQKIPSILISIQQSSGTYKYIINVPPTYQRFINNHKMKFQKGARYLFTKTSTQTIAGLTGMMLTMFESGCAYDSKLYIDEKMYEYLQTIRYKMGFKLMPYSYCTYNGQYRLGIRNKQTIFKIFQNKQTYYKTFTNLQQYIQQNLSKQQINNPLDYFNLQTKSYKDQQINIIPFTIYTNQQLITNFICIPNKLTGKVNAKKLKQLGVENKKIGELMKKGTVILDNGKVLTIDQVKQPDQPSPNFIILHINHIDSIKQIINNQIFINYIKNNQNFTQSVLYIVQHQQIVRSQQFKKLVNLIPDPSNLIQHVLFNRFYKNCNDNFLDIISTSPHMDVVSQLSEYFPLFIPNLNKLQNDFLQKHLNQMINIQTLFQGKKFHCYKKCYQLIVAPKKSNGYKGVKKDINEKKMLEDITEEMKLQVNKIMNNKQQIQQIQQIQQNNKQEIQQNNKQEIYSNTNFKQIDPKVVFLGTGSMKPSKHRNVSSIFIQYSQNNSMMLDCGQGSYYQLYNHYGPQKINQILLNLRIIFITHIHSDHNLGILDLISQRNRLLRCNKNKNQDKLYLIIPFNVLPWFHSYVQKVQNLSQGCQVIFLQWIKKQKLQLSEATMSKDQRKTKCLFKKKSEMISQDDQNIENQNQEENQNQQMAQYLSILEKSLIQTYSKRQTQLVQKFNNYLTSIGIKQFLPVPVMHCPQSHGIVITHKSGIKISYSGDTIPVNNFAKASLNSTILIHEATFGDDLIQNAQQNLHSTVGQAIDIGMKAKSWKTALTHFSQRYKSSKDIVQPALYKTNQLKYNYAMNHTIVCFDHMQMKLSQTPKLPYISRVIAAMIPNQKTQE